MCMTGRKRLPHQRYQTSVEHRTWEVERGSHLQHPVRVVHKGMAEQMWPTHALQNEGGPHSVWTRAEELTNYCINVCETNQGVHNRSVPDGT